MLPASLIDAATQQAYRDTEYRVQAAPPFSLAVGQPSAALAAAHKRHGVRCSAFISACNPLSQPLDEAANAQLHAALGRQLTQRSLKFLQGLGQHPTNGWPGEASWLVFGLTRESAKALGTRLRQNAILWAGADATPQLVLLR